MSAESRPRFAAAVSGNMSPMSPAAMAPSSASVTACSRTSASLCPCRLRIVRDVDAAQTQRSAGDQRCVSCPMPIRLVIVVDSFSVPLGTGWPGLSRERRSRLVGSAPGVPGSSPCRRTAGRPLRAIIAKCPGSDNATRGPCQACPLSGRSLYNPTIMATIEIEKLSKSYTVYQKQEGLRASLRGLFRREYRQVERGAGHRPDGGAGGVRRVSRPQRRREDDHAQAAVGRDQSLVRHGPRDGPRAVAARKRLPPPLRPGDGPEEPAVVGFAGPGVVPAAPADLPDGPPAVPRHAGRVDRAAERARICCVSRSANCRWASA